MIMNAAVTSIVLTDLAEVRAQRLLMIIRLRNVAVINRGICVRHLLQCLIEFLSFKLNFQIHNHLLALYVLLLDAKHI